MNKTILSMKKLFLLLIPALLLTSCGDGGTKKSGSEMKNNYEVSLMTVDPGHFHAALVQKTMYDQVSPLVHVYAPEGPDCEQHLARIESYNTRAVDPTAWEEKVYNGAGFFEKMLEERPGNVVVLSGNNKKKAEYIFRSIDAGLNVLADKPMIISPADYTGLVDAFSRAEEKGVLLYDIMTERYEVTTILQKLLSQDNTVFGSLLPGTADDPAVTKVSVHHFSKVVSGSPLIRPAWFFDVEQQGEGIVDVTTHLVDLVQWECFPEQILNPSDVEMVSARRWPTLISKEEFTGVTGLNEFPEYLSKDIKDGVLNVYANGEMVYKLKGIFAKVSVTWNYVAPPGGGDTHYSVMKGSVCDLIIKQGVDEKFVPTLYVENIKGVSPAEFEAKLKTAVDALPYEGLTVDKAGENAFRVNIPQQYRISHEEHFGQVTARFLEYLKAGKLPEWEVPGMITKYYTTTSGLNMAKGN